MTTIRDCEERVIEAARFWVEETCFDPLYRDSPGGRLRAALRALDAARSEAKGSEPVPEEGSALYATIREIAREEIVRLEKRVEEIAARNAIACDAIEDLERDVAALESASTKAHHTCKHGTFIGPTCEKCSKATPTTAPHAAGTIHLADPDGKPWTRESVESATLRVGPTPAPVAILREYEADGSHKDRPLSVDEVRASAPSTAPAQSTAQGELVGAPKWSSTLICECGRRHDIHESFCLAALESKHTPTTSGPRPPEPAGEPATAGNQSGSSAPSPAKGESAEAPKPVPEGQRGYFDGTGWVHACDPRDGMPWTKARLESWERGNPIEPETPVAPTATASAPTPEDDADERAWGIAITGPDAATRKRIASSIRAAAASARADTLDEIDRRCQGIGSVDQFWSVLSQMRRALLSPRGDGKGE